MPNFGTMPPTGHEIKRMAIFAHKFGNVCQIAMAVYGFIGSRQIRQYQLDEPPVQHFEICPILSKKISSDDLWTELHRNAYIFIFVYIHYLF